MSCCSLEHQVVITLNKGIVILQVHLVNYRGFFNRLWIGLKYAFGYKSKYGDWDEMILDSEHIESLEAVIMYLKGKI